MKFLLYTSIIIFFNSVQAKIIPFSIYHTNDLHSHFDGVKYSNLQKTGFIKRGGYDRLATVIDTVRTQKRINEEIVMGVDAGDFFAGTLFSALAPSVMSREFPEFEFFSLNQFDAVTLGNHEFDASNIGLEIMLEKAKKFSKSTSIVASNIFLKNKHSKLAPYIGNNSLIKTYVIKDFNSKAGNLRVAFLGILGFDACLVSKATRADVGFIGFDDNRLKSDSGALTDYLNSMIKELKEKNKVQVVVISMHGGGDEALNIAKKLNLVDIIIAGHTHEVQFSITNGIIISQTGSYGENLGLLELFYDTETQKVKLTNVNKKPFINIDDSFKSDLNWLSKIKNWRLEAFKISGNEKSNPEEIIFTPKVDFIRESKIQNSFGVLIGSALLSEINKHQAGADFYFTSMGLIRNSLYKGVPYTRADLFELLSIGFDKNLSPGVETITCYLTVKEVISLVTFLEIYSHVSNNFAPVFSDNLKFNVSKYGIPFFNRIKNLTLNGKKIEDYDRLIKIATNKYVIDNLGMVGSATYGLVKIDPKNEHGESIRTYPIYPKEYSLFIDYLKAYYTN